MPISIPRGESDDIIRQMIDVLRPYEAAHPGAQIDLYRQNPVSVRIRIVDPDFEGVGRVDRHGKIWEYLDRLPEEVVADLSSLILLTPEETARSFANMEFEEPASSIPL